MAREQKLYEIPKELETVRVIDSPKLQEYTESIQQYGERAKEVLGQFQDIDGELAGSNQFMVLQYRKAGLLSENASLATREHLEKAKSINPEFLSGNYAEFGLALKTAGDSYTPNDSLAKTLAGQLQQRDIALEQGLLLPFSVLGIAENSESAYGLVFNLVDLTSQETKEHIQDLAQFTWNWERDQGIARAYFDRDGWWYASGNLSISVGYGRVVERTAEGSAQNFLENRLADLRKKEQKEISAIQARYSRAEKVLRGEE